MNPVLIVAIPLGLLIVGMILNSLDLGYNQPPSSPEQDPLKRILRSTEKPVSEAAEKDWPVCLVGNGLFYRRLHLAVHGYGDQNGPFQSNRRNADTGDGRRQTDGSLRDAERWGQRQISDQIAPGR
jgi:hypothetical protein